MKYLIVILLSLSVHAEINLGTPAKNFDNYSQNYARAVAIGLPAYKDSELGEKLSQLFQKYSRGLQGTRIRSLDMLGKDFNLPAMRLQVGQTYYESPQGNFAAEVDLREGRVQFYQSRDELPAIDLTTAQKELPAVQKSHAGIIQKLGIPTNQLLFMKTNFLMLQAETNPRMGPVKKTDVSVGETATYALRELEGIMLEESYLKIFSKGPQVLEGIDVTWPDFRFHPEIKRIVLKTKTQLESEIVKRVSASEAIENEINIRMAVVMRPVLVRGTRYFIPSMKVGVYNKRGEAGNLFYVDMLAQRLTYQNEDQQDIRIN